MKLSGIHIYGFGRFHDYKIDFFNRPIEVIFGENEAGKTTIMSFIKCILFGFPTKIHTELRYEPKQGGRYGGKITFDSVKWGRFTVERTKGKATGDVRVFFSDGTTGTEKELNEILQEMDRTIFSGIYWFRLNDLQHLDQLKSEELNQFLYGVGMAGRRTLLDLEKNNEKNISSKYKPSGKKPSVNVQLNKVNELERNVQDWRDKLNQHEQLVKKRADLTQQIENIRNKQQDLREQQHDIERLQSLTKTVLEKKKCEAQLQLLPEYVPFPEDGMERYEKLETKILTIEAEIAETENLCERLTSNIENIELTSIFEYEQNIQNLKDYCKVYETNQEEMYALQQKIQTLEQEFDHSKSKIGGETFDYLACDLSLSAEKTISEIIDHENNLKQQEFILNSNLQQTKAVLEKKEVEVRSLTQQLLPDERRNEYKQKQLNDETASKELEYVYKTLKETKIQLERLSTNKISNLIWVAVILLSITISGFLIAYGEWIASVVLVIVSIALSYNLIRVNRSNRITNRELENKKQELLTKEIELTNTIDFLNNVNHTEINEELLKDEQIRKEIALQKLRLAEEEQNYKQLCSDFEKLEDEYKTFRTRLDNWCYTHNYPLGHSASHYIKILHLVDDLKKKRFELDQYTRRVEHYEMLINNEQRSAKKLCEKFDLNYEAKFHQQYVERLLQKLNFEKEQLTQLKLLQEKKVELDEATANNKNKIGFYKDEQQKLFVMANVKNEGEFRLKGKAWRESRELESYLRVLTSQVTPYVKSLEELKKIEEEILTNHDSFEERKLDIEEKMRKLYESEQYGNEKLASIQIEIEHLEQGSSYSECLHKFEKEKDNLKEEIRKWALYKTIGHLIQEAKSIYEKERQPEVIQEATRNFAFLSNNEYRTIYAPIGEQQFIVIRKDGERFFPTELSQATKEQLYLALRLALATIHSKETSFPIFIDDVLVNFDTNRQDQAIQLFKKLSSKHQIIYFTCHLFMAKEISKEFYELNRT